MDTQLLIICALTFVIHVIATLAYAVRIAVVRKRHIAVSISLFGIIALVDRTGYVAIRRGGRASSDMKRTAHRGRLNIRKFAHVGGASENGK